MIRKDRRRLPSSPAARVTTLLLGAVAMSCNTMTSARVQIDDPDTSEVDFRTAEFAIFRTLSPRTRVEFAPPAEPSNTRILIDGGDADDSLGWLDVTSLLEFKSGAAEAIIPHTAPFGSFPGPRERAREHPEAPDQTIVVLPGANRIRVFAGEELIASAYFLCYDERFIIIPSRQEGVQAVPGKKYYVSANELSIFFPSSFGSDAAISRFLLAEKLRPIGISAASRCLVVRDVADLDVHALLARVEQLRARMGDMQAVNVHPVPGRQAAWR